MKNENLYFSKQGFLLTREKYLQLSIRCGFVIPIDASKTGYQLLTLGNSIGQKKIIEKSTLAAK